MGVTQRDIENIARQVDGDYLLGQRRGFDPAEFQHSPVKKTRKRPFTKA
jgi:serine/threonine-protein kinase HipA